MEHGLGFSNFLNQLDGVGMTVLGLLLILSVASWYLIITKVSLISLLNAGLMLFEAFLERRFIKRR